MHSVIILENDDVMRASISELVESIESLRLEGSSATIEGGLALLKTNPDFALVDLVLDDGLSYDFISTAVSAYDTKVLIVSVLGDESSVISAIQAGADGYIKKDATEVELTSAINSILRGESPMSPTIARHLLRRVKEQEGPEPEAEPQTLLSQREQQVLEALAYGLNYKEVARKYELSHHTVAKYIKTIYRKLSVNTRAQAVVEGVRTGIISMPDANVSQPVDPDAPI
ncbi:MAG: LuxR family transcriptional regulator [Ponticaulis sp.]|nr:LuxR family transcriptional regulator [Ponticaulis sp.]